MLVSRYLQGFCGDCNLPVVLESFTTCDCILCISCQKHHCERSSDVYCSVTKFYGNKIPEAFQGGLCKRRGRVDCGNIVEQLTLNMEDLWGNNSLWHSVCYSRRAPLNLFERPLRHLRAGSSIARSGPVLNPLPATWNGWWRIPVLRPPLSERNRGWGRDVGMNGYRKVQLRYKGCPQQRPMDVAVREGPNIDGWIQNYKKHPN